MDRSYRTLREVVIEALKGLESGTVFHPLDLGITNGKGRPLGQHTIAYHLGELAECENGCEKVADGKWKRIKFKTIH